MKYLVLVFSLMICASSFSQKDSLQKQINEQVWKPFIKAFNDDDNEAFKAVHSLDIIRVIEDENHVIGYDEYFKPVPDSIKTKRSHWKRDIELRFLKRIAAAGKAFETGYYKTASTNITTGESRVSYGKFHVLLRKEQGIWKILMDQDAKEGADEKRFWAADPME